MPILKSTVRPAKPMAANDGVSSHAQQAEAKPSAHDRISNEAEPQGQSNADKKNTSDNKVTKAGEKGPEEKKAATPNTAEKGGVASSVNEDVKSVAAENAGNTKVSKEKKTPKKSTKKAPKVSPKPIPSKSTKRKRDTIQPESAKEGRKEVEEEAKEDVITKTEKTEDDDLPNKKSKQDDGHNNPKNIESSNPANFGKKDDSSLEDPKKTSASKPKNPPKNSKGPTGTQKSKIDIYELVITFMKHIQPDTTAQTSAHKKTIAKEVRKAKLTVPLLKAVVEALEESLVYYHHDSRTCARRMNYWSDQDELPPHMWFQNIQTAEKGYKVASEKVKKVQELDEDLGLDLRKGLWRIRRGVRRGFAAVTERDVYNEFLGWHSEGEPAAGADEDDNDSFNDRDVGSYTPFYDEDDESMYDY
ncbi:hypothetical protein SCUP234_03592 [Seiridium cupressi]